jgi:hypothetical protein
MNRKSMDAGRRGQRPAWHQAVAAGLTIGALCVGHVQAGALSAQVESGLHTSRYVYISSSRKDGSFGKPAEIWFMYEGGAVWVASPKTTWRVRRIHAGRPRARIAVGTRSGPTFLATGSVVTDTSPREAMFRAFAKKYPEGWSKWEQPFRQGLADGTRVLIKYTPLDTPPPSGD